MTSPAVVAMRVIEVLFFVGLVGSALTVLASWISVLKGCFRDETPTRPAQRDSRAQKEERPRAA